MDPVPPEFREEEIESIGVETLLQYLEILVKRRRLIMAIFSVITFSTLLSVLMSSPIYVAKTTILPVDAKGSSPLRGLVGASAQLMGFNLPTGGDISLIYEPIVRSRRVITNVLRSSFNSAKHEEMVPLLDIMEIDAGSLEERLDDGYKRFINGILEVKIDPISKITTVLVGTTEPQLSADIAHSLVEEIDKYGRERTMAEAGENKVFIEERLAETLNLLEKAEGDLKVFRETNKRIENSPDLQLEQGRLSREVLVQEEVYLTLKKEHEVVKIEEVKSLPIIRILDEAVAPIKKSKPKRFLIMVITMFLALLLGVAVVFGKEYFKNLYANDEHASLLRRATSPLIEDYNFVRRHARWRGVGRGAK